MTDAPLIVPDDPLAESHALIRRVVLTLMWWSALGMIVELWREIHLSMGPLVL